jgi:hypothetical protein
MQTATIAAFGDVDVSKFGKAGGTMSTPLVAALRESCDYLRDADYHQTAQLMTTAADEIERLNRKLQALEA